MNTSLIIYNKLNEFYKKFYYNEIIKGLLLFFSIGFLYFIFTSLLEFFIWFNSTGRAILFYLFILIELALLFKLVFWPILKLTKLAHGISYDQAAEMLQNHFPNEVGDKLKNLLQLNALINANASDLLLASIDQKSKELAPVPFAHAINFNSNKKYLPLVFLPILIVAYFIFVGKQENLSSGFKRIANYDQVFEKPAPFSFKILNSDLVTKEAEDFILEFKTEGEIIPDRVSINYNGESYFAEKIKPGSFKFIFTNVNSPIEFFLEANSYTSRPYKLNLINLPVIDDFKLTVAYPSYLNKPNVTYLGSGNLIVPEGSKVSWQIHALHTDEVIYKIGESEQKMIKSANGFSIQKTIQNGFSYQIVTQNSKIKYQNAVSYAIDVVKDEFPTLEVQQIPDSIAKGKRIYHGKAADDYGLTKMRVLYYDTKNPSKLFSYALPIETKTATKFVYQFPTGLKLEENTSYAYYFEAVDNDAVNHFKSTKSNAYIHNELNQIEKQDENLNNQMHQINALQKSLNQTKSAEKKSNEMNQMLKQNSELDYKDVKKLQDFFNSEIENQKKIEEAAKKLAEKFEEKNKKLDDEKAKELEKRLENLQKEQEKNKKLYEELQKYTDKLSKEELLKKMQQAKQNVTQQKRSLEQLVEQTKRFYVEQKAEQIAQKLDNLAQKQEQLSKENNPDATKQDQLNKAFDEVKKDLQELKQENEGLKKPMDVPDIDKEAEETKQEMNKASDQLKKSNPSSAKQNQKKAAQKMKEMAQKMQDGMQGQEMEQLEEDAKALRQILKNLLKFSFTQESTMKAFKANGSQSFHFNRLLKEEQKLKNQFKFIDDSLYTLASRQMAIQDIVNKSVGEIHYNIDQSLHQLVENNLPKGISHQQYVINHSNVLADLLSEALTNMQNQMQMNASGQGKGKPRPGQGDPQLSDIIQKQKGLEQKFGEGMQKKEGEKGENGEKKGDKPNGQKPGDKTGSQGNEGKNGEDGGEGESERLLEIYKEQQQLREALQKAIGNKPGNAALEKTLEEMKKLERNLLRKGFSKELLNQFKNLNHELLKLQDALKEQGEDEKRQGNANKENFTSKDTQIPQAVLDYIKGTEILQKNNLPLQPKYENLVKEYFK